MGVLNPQKAIIWIFLTLILLKGYTTITISNNAQEIPTNYFKIVFIAPTGNPARLQHAQVITRELWKIGIDAKLILVGMDPLIQRIFHNVNFEGADGDGFDIGFFGRHEGYLLTHGSLSDIYHSNKIDKVAGGKNFFPINNSKLDRLLNLIDTELNFQQRREYVHQALDIIVWEEHPVMGIYQAANPFALDADLQGFDAVRWDLINIHVQDLYYENNDQKRFKFASNARFINLNPAVSNSYYDSLVYQPTQAWTYQRDANMVLTPVLATGEPIAVGSNDTIESIINLSSISPDSPYVNATTMTVWGPNPNIDAIQYNPYKTKANKSMFLINLREKIPWHPGWGYTLGQRNVTVKDFQWTLGYWMNEELNSPNGQAFKDIYGANPAIAIQKINATMFKLNLRGRLGNGQVADWFDACRLCPLPRHVLDPTFDASPYGGSIGIAPDGTMIAAYENHSAYSINTGKKPLLGVGPYYFESWNETSQIAKLKKFKDWGGYGPNSLWNDSRYVQNNIDTYEVTVYPSKESAEIDLENGKIDGIDAQFQMGSDISYLQTKPNIQVLLAVSCGIQAMGFNTYHPRLSNRYVRLAISHMVPSQKIVEFILGDLGTTNEVVGLHPRNPFMPSKEEWNTIGLDVSENVIDPETNELLEFQGHITNDMHKAWALMEKAGYDMTPWRETVPIRERESAFRNIWSNIWPLQYWGIHYHYYQEYNLIESPEWGVRLGDVVTWRFKELEYIGSFSLEAPFDYISTPSNYGGTESTSIPLHENSMITISVVNISEGLQVQKEIDGIQGLARQLDKVPYIIPLNLNWTDYWITRGYRVERNDDRSFLVILELEEGNGSFELEFDKTNGVLQRFEYFGQLCDEQAHVLLVRTIQNDDNSVEQFFIDISVKELIMVATVSLGSGITGMGLAQLLRMRRDTS
ncbi:MAG: ABC transporter substrate-binding protein [Candidatus Hodarchaeota archaeon]